MKRKVATIAVKAGQCKPGVTFLEPPMQTYRKNQQQEQPPPPKDTKRITTNAFSQMGHLQSSVPTTMDSSYRIPQGGQLIAEP